METQAGELFIVTELKNVWLRFVPLCDLPALLSESRVEGGIVLGEKTLGDRVHIPTLYRRINSFPGR